MIKKITTFALASLMTTSLLAVEEKSELGISLETKNKIENIQLIKKYNGTVTKGREFGNLFLIEGEVGPNRQFLEFAVTKDMKTLILGKLYDTNTTAELHVTTTDTASLLKKADFTYGNGPETIFVFVDPTCPGCAQFESHWPKLKDKYTIKVFIWALPSHTNSPMLADYILSAPTDAEKYTRLLEHSQGINTYQTTPVTAIKQQQIRRKLAEVNKMASTLSLAHTPTVLGMDLKEKDVGNLFKN